ncbi:MAG: hypothetical protein CL947_04545 [Epsilonproteobacteria bacterium]|nr:hypothetical protein [Campylobacterota bacterium]|tara:strand:- start:2644 stop:3240 length:597 start_codon:yes stop_codon:yes gene_type:complete
MISSLFGTITAIDSHKVCLMQNNIGFEIFCPQTQTLSLQQEVTLHTYLHWNQEQGPSLFGFLQSLDKDVFLLVISCSGIGPKMGLSILEQLDASQFLQLIIEENITELSKLKSIGAKKAEQLCISLRTKAPKLLKSHPQLATKTPIGLWNDLNETLTSLNYSTMEIKQATSILKDEVKETTPSFDLLLRKALQILAKK